MQVFKERLAGQGPAERIIADALSKFDMYFLVQLNSYVTASASPFAFGINASLDPVVEVEFPAFL